MVTDALSNYLSHANMTDFNVQKYIAALHKSNYTATPAIGAGISGGGYAPAIFGTGLIRALDGRQPEAVAAGTGGLLQSMSFYSGQSGGSWAVMSYIASDGATTDQLLQYWQPQINRFISQEASSHTGTTKTYLEQMGAKLQAGFKVSVGDYLGLGNGYECECFLIPTVLFLLTHGSHRRTRWRDQQEYVRYPKLHQFREPPVTFADHSG